MIPQDQPGGEESVGVPLELPKEEETVSVPQEQPVEENHDQNQEIHDQNREIKDQEEEPIWWTNMAKQGLTHILTGAVLSKKDVP